MTNAAERRYLLQRFDCFICNQEARLLFLDDYSEKTPKEMQEILVDKVVRAKIPSMVVTLGAAFCAGVASGLTYGKTLAEAVEIGTMLAASVITSSENVCPRFQPAELGLNYPG